MKKGVMTLLVLAGLTGMGAIQAMGDIKAEQAGSELLTSSIFHEGGYGNSGMVFPGNANSQLSMSVIRKTLKGYSSMKRTSYLTELMHFV